MGYGFTIEDNQADTFGLGFSAGVTRSIHNALSARGSETSKSGKLIHKLHSISLHIFPTGNIIIFRYQI